MKDTLKRLMGITPKPAQAELPKEEVDMTVDAASGAEKPSAVQVDVASLQATVTSLTEQLAASQAQVAELSAFAEAAAEFKANKEKAEAEAKIKARTEKLVAVVGTVAAAGLQTATASMDDTAFDAVVAAMTFKASTEAASPAFKEAGVEGEASAEQVATQAQSNRVMDYLKNITHETQAK